MFTSMDEARDGLRADFRDLNQAALKPRSRLTLPDWADKYRRLASSSGAIGGPWRTSRVEVARGPMMAVTEPGVRNITLQTCTQLMKTSILENIIGYFAHLDPCPILLTQPKDDSVKQFSKERLMPMVRATPVLRKILSDDRERGGQDTLGYKSFPGGFLAMVSAGSPSNLAMRPIRLTLADEIDKYETSTKEGDPLALLEARTATFFRNSLHVRACSPTWVETSRIAKSYEEGDQRRAFLRCPHCEYEQTLSFFKHVHWNKSEEGEHFPYTAAILCENCGKEWSESDRLRIITTPNAVRWFQTKPFVCCEVRQEPMQARKWRWHKRYQVGYAQCVHCGGLPVPNTHASFQAGKLYSPFDTIPALAAQWILSKDNPETKQTFYNTVLGEAFAVHALKKIETHSLAARREKYAATVPRGVLRLTAGVDVQPGSEVNHGRLEVELVGWGLGEESWSIAHEVFQGDPAAPELWKELDDFLSQRFEYEGGGSMRVHAACIDSGGHNTQDVYKFARARLTRNIWAIKGAAERGGQWNPVWPIPRLNVKRSKVTGFKPIVIGVNSAKESVRQKLMVESPGPGFCHFPEGRPEAWFDQLTSESLVLEKKGGFNVKKWVLPRGKANEAFDTRVYAYAALCGLYAVRKLNLERVAELLELIGPDDTPDGDPPGPSKPTPRTPRRSVFVG